MSDMMSQGWSEISGIFSGSYAIPIILFFLLGLILLFIAPFNFSIYLLGDYKSKNDRKSRRKSLRPRVLIVDDDEASVLSLLSILESKFAIVKVVHSGEDMMEELSEDEFDVVFVDREMPYLKGDAALAVSDQKLSLNRKIPVVFFTGVEENFELPKVEQFSILDVWGKKTSYKKLEEKVSLLLRNIQKGGQVAYS